MIRPDTIVTDRPPTEEEVAAELKLPRKKLSIIKKAIRVYSSAPQTDQPEEGTTLDDLVEDCSTRQPDTEMAHIDELGRVLVLLDTLDSREAQVVRLRFGLSGEEPKTLKEIGEIISAETLDLDDGGKAITGSSRHTFMLPRSWDIMGMSRRFANKSILILMYTEKDPVQPSLGTIVVEGNPAEGELLGYWQGFDRDRNKLVACPYVLSRTADFGIVRARQSAWLERPCYLQP